MVSNGQSVHRISAKGDIMTMVPNQLSVENILRALSAGKSLVLLSTIALSNPESEILMSRLGLTRKQYYSRLSALAKAGLIKRRNKRYFLTSFGKIVYDVQLIIGKALENHWKLAAIDSIESPGNNVGLSTEERNKIIEVLIKDPEIKESVLKERHPAVTNNDIAARTCNNNNGNNRGELPTFAYS
jgi:DNA-binding HxlR family transcriptional regulator